MRVANTPPKTKVSKDQRGRLVFRGRLFHQDVLRLEVTVKDLIKEEQVAVSEMTRRGAAGVSCLQSLQLRDRASRSD